MRTLALSWAAGYAGLIAYMAIAWGRQGLLVGLLCTAAVAAVLSL